MNKFTLRIFFVFYSLQIFALFLYSFTQIDLGLALTRFPWAYTIQQAFQSVGYFNRPLSALLYGVIITLLFCSYLYLLRLVSKGILKRNELWKFIVLITVILTFSYNAFSHDIFNYIFDAKIFTFYGQNPYEHKALDFPQDPMLGFMHWTHRVYPYGPAWLGMTIPLSFLGMNIFILTFFLFKLLAACSYLGTAYFIEKIVDKNHRGKGLVSLVFFAFNPFVINEVLISAHNDIVMMFLAIASLYLLLHKKYLFSVILLGVSVATKYATVFVVPFYLAIGTLQYMKINIPWKVLYSSMVMIMCLAVFAAMQSSGNFQPWYLLFVLPFSALVYDSIYIRATTLIVTFGSVLYYIPFLFLGDWDSEVQYMLQLLYLSVLVLIVLTVGILFFVSRKKAVK